MLFITTRLPKVNTEPKLNPNFEFDLTNNASSRGFFCCRRNKKGKYEEVGSAALLSEIKASQDRKSVV